MYYKSGFVYLQYNSSIVFFFGKLIMFQDIAISEKTFRFTVQRKATADATSLICTGESSIGFNDTLDTVLMIVVWWCFSYRFLFQAYYD